VCLKVNFEKREKKFRWFWVGLCWGLRIFPKWKSHIKLWHCHLRSSRRRFVDNKPGRTSSTNRVAFAAGSWSPVSMATVQIVQSPPVTQQGKPVWCVTFVSKARISDYPILGTKVGHMTKRVGWGVWRKRGEGVNWEGWWWVVSGDEVWKVWGTEVRGDGRVSRPKE